MSTLHKLLLFAGPLLLILLTALAGYTITTINSLYLPIPTPLSLFTILLPLLTYITSTLTTRLLRQIALQASSPSPSSRSQQIINCLSITIPLILLQALYNTTIFISSLQSATTSTRCTFEPTWSLLYTSHDEHAIRTIQDSLQCCGFAGPRDRAWPFPSGREGEPGYVNNGECERRFGYRQGCLVPWEQRYRVAGGRLAVVAGGVFLVQIIYYISVLYSAHTTSWLDTIKAIAGSGSNNENRRAMRGLIEADANGDSERVREVLDREEDEESVDTVTEGNNRRIEGSRTDSGPRVETSPLLDGWRERGDGRS